MATTIPLITAWTVTPIKGTINFFDEMNTWLSETNTVLASWNLSIENTNLVYQDINVIFNQIQNQAVSGGYSQAYINRALIAAYVEYTATGGETSTLTADNTNLQIYKDGVLQVEITDYTLNADNVTIDWVSPLTSDDFIQWYDLNKLNNSFYKKSETYNKTETYNKIEIDDIITPLQKQDLSITIDITADADQVLTASQIPFGRIEITDIAVPITAQRKITLDNTEHTFLFVNNADFPLEVIALSGSGIVVPNVAPNNKVTLRNDTVNIIKYENETSIVTSEVSTEGQSWDGVAYTDPDAVGANPTAKIYPDGIVVGSTDNGTYTKYPNGDIEMEVEASLGIINNNTTTNTTLTLPMVLTAFRNATPSAFRNDAGASNSIGRITCAWYNVSANPTTAISLAVTNATSLGSVDDVKAGCGIKGSWK